ncbi:MAG: Ig-like domain-containing protein, partial [Woeseiaceae bacterium]
HTLSAVAADEAGNKATSAPIAVTVDNGPPPDETPPSVSMTAPGDGATVSGTVQVTASASDDVGVAGVQFRLDGVDLGAPDTSAPFEISWDTTTASDGPHTLSAVASDEAGNTATSAPITVIVDNAAPPPDDTTTRFEEDDPAVSVDPVEAWQLVGPEAATFSGGNAGNSNTSGATLTFTFTGTSVTWIGLKCNICGIATVSIDGGPEETVDTAGPAAPGDAGLASEPVFTASGLAADTTHVLVITVTGTPSGGANVVVDAFDVTGSGDGAGGTTHFEEISPEVAFADQGDWQLRGAEVATFSGGNAASSEVAGATSTLTFTGTSVTWIGLNCNVCGIASVSIDGTGIGEVDTASPAAPGSPGLASETVFTASGLAAGVTHTLVIAVTGSTTSGGTFIIVDAFDVTPGFRAVAKSTILSQEPKESMSTVIWLHGQRSR